MAKNIKSIFDTHGANIKIDKKLIRESVDYANKFVNKSEDNINFFGGHEIGVHPVKFKTSDRHEYLIDILGLEEQDIRAEVKELDTVGDDWVRGNDVMNLSCLWLAHKFKTSNLSTKDKYEGMYQSMLILNFKLITSLMGHFFPHPVNPQLSQMIYDELSFKFTLKKEGSWMGLMKERARDIVSDNGIHRETLSKFDDDGDIQYMITDIQGRLRSIIKNLWAELERIMKSDARRHKLSYFSDLEGEIVVKDMSKKYSTYREYIEKTVSSTPNEFIKSELVKVVGELLPNMPQVLLGSALIAFHDKYGRKDKITREWLDTIVSHCFEQVASGTKSKASSENISELLVYMRSLYTASKSKGDVERMRVIGDKFVKKNVKNNNGAVIASVRTGLMLYILLRMFSKDHYD